MRTKVTFREIMIRERFRVRCPKCRKMRPKVLVDSYMRNGLHDEAATATRIAKALRKERKRLQGQGLVCSSCEREG